MMIYTNIKDVIKIKILGIISEYNPFHLGHLYHLNESKKKTNCNYTICIMSGNFLQRGEPALLDKWSRSKMAILNGVDLVIELPFVYSCQTAEYFSKGAISILDSLNVLDYLSFGTESEDLDELNFIAQLLNNEPDLYQSRIKLYLKEGLSYPKSKELAMKDYLHSNNLDLNSDLFSSNNILGIEYLRSLNKLNSKIIPLSVQRKSSNHNDVFLRKNISSATSIRNTIFENNNLSDIESFVPKESYYVMEKFLNEFKYFNRLENLSSLIFYTLLKSSNETISNIFNVNNDILNSIINSLPISNDLTSLLSNIKSKNYTMSRIKRILIHNLFDLNKADTKSFLNLDRHYIRVLASNTKGFEILRKIKSNSNSIIINKFSEIKNIDDDKLLKMLHFDKLSTDFFFLSLNNKNIKLSSDFYNSPYIKK